MLFQGFWTLMPTIYKAFFGIEDPHRIIPMKFRVVCYGFTCDEVAYKKLLNKQSHSGFSACHRCLSPGDYATSSGGEGGKVVHPLLDISGQVYPIKSQEFINDGLELLPQFLPQFLK